MYDDYLDKLLEEAYLEGYYDSMDDDYYEKYTDEYLDGLSVEELQKLRKTEAKKRLIGGVGTALVGADTIGRNLIYNPMKYKRNRKGIYDMYMTNPAKLSKKELNHYYTRANEDNNHFRNRNAVAAAGGIGLTGVLGAQSLYYNNQIKKIDKAIAKKANNKYNNRGR